MQFKLIIEVYKAPEKSKGGIIFADKTKDVKQFEYTRGTIVGVGPAAFTDEEQYPGDQELYPGLEDEIWFDKHAGHQIKSRDGMVLYRVIEDTDVVGLWEEGAADLELVA